MPPVAPFVLVFSVSSLAMTVHALLKRAWTTAVVLVASSSVLQPLYGVTGVKAQNATQYLLGMGIGDITG